MSSRRPGGRKRVLIVDDHALVRAGFTELINGEEDLEVCGEAADVTRALVTLRADVPDLVLVDLTLREGNGLDLIRQVATWDPSIKMLACSMHDPALFAERALGAGAMGYVTKQEPLRVVLEAIRRVLSGRIYASEEIADRLLRRASGKRQDRGDTAFQTLSDRELEVMGRLGEGLKTSEIAERLHLSIKTIDTYREHIKCKLGLKSANELLRAAVVWTLDPNASAHP